MKKITIFLAALLLVFAAGCREDASLDGLESQTKEEGTSAGENAESIAVKEALTYESALEYNWVAEYAPAAGKSYTILFNFLSDSSVATDSPVSENEKNLALFSVSALKEGGVIIKFDGPTMLNDEIVDSEFRERQLIVESTTETTINCIGASSGKPVVLTKATSEDVLKLGEKLVWLALSKKNAMQGVLRDGENKFLARYAVDKKSRSMEFTWIDAANKDAKHESAGFELEVTDTQYGIQWPAVTINGVGYSSLTYTIAGESLAFNVADAKITAVTEAHPGFVDKASKQYNLGGKLECGTAHPTLWSALVSDKFRSILFYPYADDIPLRVEVYVGDGTTGNYLFVNDYTTDPKTARFDSDADWIRFYASVQGDFLKIATGSEIASYPISQAADITAFKATTVPVGEDQLPMLEQTKEIVRKFNAVYGETLVEPEILLPDNKACLRLPGTDGKAKMSKSLGNCIYLSDTEEEVRKKIMSMYTDPTHLQVSDPGHIEGNTVFTYLDAFCKDEQFAEYLPEYANLDELKEHYQRGGLGDVKVKKFLNNVLQEELAPIRARRKEWEKDIPAVYEILHKGSIEAEKVAAQTLADVKNSMKINYFEDHALITEQAERFKAE